MSEHDETRPIATETHTETDEPTAVTEVIEHDEHDEQDEAGTHPVNVAHLVMGLAFVLMVGVWALVVGDVVEGRDVRWLLPLPFLAAGATGLMASAVRGRSMMSR